MGAPFKDILAVVISRQGDDGVLEAAACLARGCEAHASLLILAIHPASNFAPTVAPLSVILEDLARAPEGDAALKQKAIMGGYGHARAAEWLLGGATFEMIELADIPILMSH